MSSTIQITECPRDAMQGLSNFIPTGIKSTYINLLLQVGFDTIDFGSFVSAKAIPQMRDTATVLEQLDLSRSKSKLLAIVANYRGAEDAVKHDQISYLGFPLSISETFQQRNTNASRDEAFDTVENIQELCDKRNKKLRVYLSMGFGNPYGDEWSTDILLEWIEPVICAGIYDIFLADTVGIATSQQITDVMKTLNRRYTNMQFGIHLHSTPDTWYDKIDAACESGCRRFDTALKGYGGCPMAKEELTGNIATENLVDYLLSKNIDTGLNFDKLKEALDYSDKIFNQ